jgi:protein tyrosine/serine phosphatase
MKTTNYTMRVLQAEEGKYLTQAEDVDALERIVTADKVYLAANASEDDWREISQEEADAFEAARKEAEEAARGEAAK